MVDNGAIDYDFGAINPVFGAIPLDFSAMPNRGAVTTPFQSNLFNGLNGSDKIISIFSLK